MGWRKSETMINSREFHRQFGAKKLYILNKFFAYFWIVKGMCNGREREREYGEGKVCSTLTRFVNSRQSIL